MSNTDLRSIKKTIVITAATRSGSFLLHNLLDGHPHIITHPPHTLGNLADNISTIFNYYTRFIKYVNKAQQPLSNEQLKHLLMRKTMNFSPSYSISLKLPRMQYDTFVTNLISFMPDLFTDYATNPNPETQRLRNIIPEQFAYIKSTKIQGASKEEFHLAAITLLEQHFLNYDYLLFTDVFALIFFAYETVANKKNIINSPVIVWQKHLFFNRGNQILDATQSELIESVARNAIYITTVRRPDEGINSWLTSQANTGYRGYGSAEECYKYFVCHFVNSITAQALNGPQYAVRFEDMHKNTKALTEKLCEISEIPWHPILLETTLDGQEVGFVNRKHKIKTEMVTGVNKNLKPSNDYKHLTQEDVRQITILFHNAYKLYNYDINNSTDEPSKGKYLLNLSGLDYEQETMKKNKLINLFNIRE